MLTRQTITERVELSEVRVDRKNGVIRNARLLGRDSKNGRRYSDRAMESAMKFYPGMDIRVEHAKRAGQQRGLLETIGYVLDGSVKPGNDGAAYGDLQLFTTNPAAQQILEMAEKNPRVLGLSHDADAELNGSIVEDVTGINSLDFVRRPATNSNLFESEGDDMADIALADYAKQLPESSPVRKAITESLERCPDLTVPKQATAEAVLTALVESLAAAPAKGEKPAGAPGDDNALATTIKSLTESVTRLEMRDVARSVLTEQEIEPTAARVDELSALGSRENMVARINQWGDDVLRPSRKTTVIESLAPEAGSEEIKDWSPTAAMSRWGVAAAAK